MTCSKYILLLVVSLIFSCSSPDSSDEEIISNNNEIPEETYFDELSARIFHKEGEVVEDFLNTLTYVDFVYDNDIQYEYLKLTSISNKNGDIIEMYFTDFNQTGVVNTYSEHNANAYCTYTTSTGEVYKTKDTEPLIYIDINSYAPFDDTFAAFFKDARTRRGNNLKRIYLSRLNSINQNKLGVLCQVFLLLY